MKKIVLICTLSLLVVGGFFCLYLQKHQPKNVMNSQPALAQNGSEETISAVIVPHFDYFKDKRLELLKNVSQKSKPKTIVLISVNHFNTGLSNVLTTDKSWNVANGEVAADKKLFDNLVSANVAQNDESAFANEHGIKNILSDVKTTFGQADILPIIIKDTTKNDEVEKLSGWLEDNCRDCLVVASVDFSHYCPSSLADVHDSYSIQALAAMDEAKISKAETDSPQTLSIVNSIAKNNKQNFHLFYNSNSGSTSEKDAEVTSVVLGYYSSKSAEKVSPSTSFVIAGDAMFDRDVWNGYGTNDFKTLFDNFGVRPFAGVDFSLLNLEGPISPTEISGTRTRDSMSFNFSPKIPSVLKSENISTVSLANNHTQNAGAAGFANTTTVLNQAGINHFGISSGLSEQSLIHVDGPIPVSIIGVMTLSSYSEEYMTTLIQAEKAAGRFVIVFPHWGTEYEPIHSTSQENMAKSWTSAGADLIIGSHPHVTEDFGIVNGKPVIYSLGNFIFDQFFSQPTQEGLVLAGTISADKITLTFLPTKEVKIKPQFMIDKEKSDKIKSIIDLDSANAFFKKSSRDTIIINR